MHRWLLVVGLAGCGRIDFSGTATDSAVDDGGSAIDAVSSGPPRIVNVTSNSGTTFRPTIDLPETIPGTLLVVVTANTNQANAIDGLRDNFGRQFTYVNARADLNLGGDNIVEIMYSAAATGGVNQLTFQQSTSSVRDIWVFELAGLALAPPVDQAVLENITGAPDVEAPTVSAPAQSIVISVAGVVTDSIVGIDSASPFTALPILHGSSAAFYFPPIAGTYSAAWDDSVASPRFAASSVVFAH